jgi:hypothetical protein
MAKWGMERGSKGECQSGERLGARVESCPWASHGYRFRHFRSRFPFVTVQGSAYRLSHLDGSSYDRHGRSVLAGAVATSAARAQR